MQGAVETNDPKAAARDVAPLSVALAPGMLAWVVTIYFAQGLPFSIVHQVAPLLFVDLGQPTHVQTMTALYQLAWIAKPLWAQLVDGRSSARTWIFAAEIGLAILLATLAFPAARGDVLAIAVGLAILSFVAATHDIAIDAFYLRVLDTRAQAELSGLRIGAYRVAMIAGKGGLVMFAAWASWRSAFLLSGAAFAALALLHRVTLPSEPDRTATRAPSLRDAFASYFARDHIAIVVAFIVLYRAGDVMLFAVSPAFLKWLGMTTHEQGLYSGTFGAIAFVAGAAAGAAFVARKTLEKTLVPLTLIQNLAIPIYVALALAVPSKPIVVGAMLVEQFAAGVGNAAFAVFLMRMCKPDFKASHFAIGTGLMGIPMALLGSMSGFLSERISFAAFFLIAFAMSLPALALTSIVKRRPLREA